jgi:tRNA threonylcarbamoyladenosine biosynthesis protein TsaE
MRRSLAVTSRSPEETRILGAALAPMLLPGDVISLSGDLGAGKTVFVQGLGAALGVTARVSSPTFTIVHEYWGRYPIIHIDVYRLDSFQEVLDLGFDELLDPEAIMIVEWGEAVAPMLPQRYVDIDIRRAVDPDLETYRDMVFRPRGDDWVVKLEGMRKTAEALLDAASMESSGGERFSYAPMPIPRDHRKTAEE